MSDRTAPQGPQAADDDHAGADVPTGSVDDDSLPFQGPEWAGASSSRWRTGASAGPGNRIKISRRKKRALRRRRRVGLVLVLLGGFVLLLGAYLLVTGLLARSELEKVRSGVDALRLQVSAGQLPAARKTATEVATHASRARTLTSGPVWALAADLPGGGEPLETLRGVAIVANDLGSGVLPHLVKATEQLNPVTLRRPDGGIDLAPLAALAPDLRTQSARVSSATKRLAALPASTWLASADAARASVLQKLTSLGRTIHSAEVAARVAPPMLGGDGVRRYLVAFETEAELRGLGGLPGAFAIVKADRGRLSFERFESDTTLVRTPSRLRLGSNFDNLYHGADATADYLDSDVSPHFPYAAQIWAAMWLRHSGERLDGALAVDPTALSYLLAVSGPAALSDGTQVTAANVVSLTQQQVYARFPSPDQAARKAYQLAIAKAVSSRLLARTGSTTALLKAAGRAATEHRLLVWSADPALERALGETSLAGTVASSAIPLTGLSINNAGGNKLDYYLHMAMTWQRSGCGATRHVTVTIKATNAAPAGLPAYVTGITARRGYPPRPGDNVLLLGVYATAGADFTSVSLDGKAFSAATGIELGHPVYTLTVPLPRGRQRTIVVHLVEPDYPGTPTVLRQPMVNPMSVTVVTSMCS